MNRPFRLPLLLALILPAQGIVVRSYNPAIHDRFTGFPAAPVMNPGFLYDAAKFTGVGWWNYGSVNYGLIHYQVTAVSPRHLLTATHAQPPGGTVIRFIDSTGAIVDRTTASVSPVPADGGGASDLCVVTLTSPLPASVATYPWLNLPGGQTSYAETVIRAFGPFQSGGTPRAGEGTISNFEDLQLVEGGPPTRVCYFDYVIAAGAPDDCCLSPGDSGGPSFANLSGGRQALLGIHISIDPTGTIQRNYDTFLPHYASRIDTILAPSGHRLSPVNFTATALAIPAATPSPATLRRFNPGRIGFSVANPGGDLTGNLAVTVTFPAGHEPSSLSAPGWVAEAGGPGIWNLRAATLAASANLTFTASWNALPDLQTITASISADSDTASAIAANPTFTLGPSYADWADGLAQPCQTADPDGDHLENLLEYALGGDPESGVMTLPGGHPLLPVLTSQAGTVSLTFPERDDAVLRGLSYVVETSTSPATLAGATTLPAGASSTTATFSPAVPGFVKRTITWSADGPMRFARVKVELAE